MADHLPDVEQVRGKAVIAAIDFHRTAIYAVDAAPGHRPVRLVTAADPKGYFHKVYHRAGNPGGVYEDDSSEYWEAISDALAPAAAILALGHGQGRANASHHWVAYVGEHRKDVAVKTLAEVRGDIEALSDEQVVRLAQHYLGHAPPRNSGDGRWGEPQTSRPSS